MAVPVPEKAEQKKTAQTQSAFDVEPDQLSAQLAELKQQKKGLMQKLLSGDVRVKTQAEQGTRA